MPLGVGHGTGVEPDVDEVGLPVHFAARFAHQHDGVDKGAVQIEVLRNLPVHESRLYGALHLRAQLGQGADAFFFAAVFGAPYGQGCAPVARAAQVPVDQVFQPVAKASGAGGCGLPVDRFVQLHQAFLAGRSADEPGVDGIIEYGLVGAPAMRIGMHEFLHPEGFVFFLEFYGDQHIGGAVVWIVLVFVGVVFDVHPGKIGDFRHETALFVDDGHLVALFVLHHDAGYVVFDRNAKVVGTEGLGHVHDAGAVFGGDEIGDDHPQGGIGKRHIGQQLLVLDVRQILPAVLPAHLPGNELVARPVGLKVQVFGRGIEPGRNAVAGEYHLYGFEGVGVEGADFHIPDVFAHGERVVCRQRPGRGGPGQEVLVLRSFDAELRHDGAVFHVAVATGLVEFMRTQPRAGGRRIGLDGIAPVQQPFIVKLFEQVPEAFHVVALEGDVGIAQVDPEAHDLGEIIPFALVLHHRLPAFPVELLHRNALAYVFFGNSEFLFHLQFHGKAMCVPSALAPHPVAFQGFVAAKDVFDRTRHDVVDAGGAVGRGGAFVKSELRRSRAQCYRFLKNPVFFPIGEHLLAQPGKIRIAVFPVFHGQSPSFSSVSTKASPISSFSRDSR